MKYGSLFLCSLASIFSLLGCDESSSNAGAPDSAYRDLCEFEGINCQAGSNPPTLLPHYEGTGITLSTTNDLWAVGEKGDFSTTLDLGTSGVANGVFDMGFFELEVVGAAYKGNGEQFTIYGEDLIDLGNECTVTVRAVVSGEQSASNGSIAGKLALEWVEVVNGANCEPEELSYPGTGATFSFNAESVDCGARIQKMDAFLSDPLNLSCESDFECVVDRLGCAEVSSSFCGQVALSFEALISDEWATLKNEVRSCTSNTCATCEAELTPTCVEGSCR